MTAAAAAASTSAAAALLAADDLAQVQAAGREPARPPARTPSRSRRPPSVAADRMAPRKAYFELEPSTAMMTPYTPRRSSGRESVQQAGVDVGQDQLGAETGTPPRRRAQARWSAAERAEQGAVGAARHHDLLEHQLDASAIGCSPALGADAVGPDADLHVAMIFARRG